MKNVSATIVMLIHDNHYCITISFAIYHMEIVFLGNDFPTADGQATLAAASVIWLFFKSLFVCWLFFSPCLWSVLRGCGADNPNFRNVSGNCSDKK